MLKLLEVVPVLELQLFQEDADNDYCVSSTGEVTGRTEGFCNSDCTLYECKAGICSNTLSITCGKGYYLVSTNALVNSATTGTLYECKDALGDCGAVPTSEIQLVSANADTDNKLLIHTFNVMEPIVVRLTSHPYLYYPQVKYRYTNANQKIYDTASDEICLNTNKIVEFTLDSCSNDKTDYYTKEETNGQRQA
ncbi:hypothetical protein LY90DRAFT_521045 [Neocallimastix californiae]|uniref:Uncharacterized protein n=1 Tax=Neocallimastix californiae TaxID=1754190 RepID=A0A1Y1XW51_9FUNG|nr:hypothetical protein LY90DRAFT_521045 [Neocallimastix californiae]|eukprot:ORX89962.1 hypothetical protein LY90DRAFT_521045 [Neocallimastix californiae]